MTAQRHIIRVAVPAPLHGGFDYIVDTQGDAAVPGARVRVPFGRRQMVAVVTAVDVTPSVSADRLRAVTAVVDTAPVIGAQMRQLLDWVAAYYHHPLGEVYAAALPTRLRQGHPARPRQRRLWQATAAGRALDRAGLKRAHRQRAVLDWLCDHDTGVDEGQLREQFEGVGRVIKRLEERGLAACQTVQLAAKAQALEPAPSLNDEQRSAVESVSVAGGFAAHLIEGVTGSGKTEVYLALAKQVLSAGRQVLVLVPEIGLTPQLIHRFATRLGQMPVVLHSGLTDHERSDAWLAAATGSGQIILGTRSAIFTPLAKPGLIVVDEEHDASYKQQDGLRYSARDVAVRRAQMDGVPVLLGSATPSLESLHNAATGRYHHAQLRHRAGGAAVPRFKLLDVRSRPLEEGMSKPLLERVRAHLDAGGQALLFLNRRGYAPALVCHDCGWVAPCTRCDTGMTLHRGANQLRCHHCGAQSPVPAVCGSCASPKLVAAGEGTERIAAALRSHFPGVPMARFDRDTVTRKGSLERMLAAVRSGQTRLLVGTQMLAKGHDFPDLTFVGVVSADHGLFSADFRALERMAQLVTQVAGRAGRGQRPGEVVLQTRHPDHPLLRLLAGQGYAAFADATLVERRDAGLPPFGYLALLRAESTHERAPLAFLDAAAGLAGQRAGHAIELWGPVPAPMQRRAGRHRGQLLLRASARRDLHGFLRTWLADVARLQQARRVRWSLDVDPLDLL